MTTRNLPACQPTRRRRAAYTLIEILVVITVFVFLLASMAIAIGTLFQAKGRMEIELQRATQLARLDAQLRSDAHQAVSVEQPEDDRIVFRLQPQRIEYLVQAKQVVRSLRQGEAVLHREYFPLAAKTTILWNISSTEQSATSVPLLSATVTYEPEDPTRAREIDRLDAAVGLHRRAAE